MPRAPRLMKMKIIRRSVVNVENVTIQFRWPDAGQFYSRRAANNARLAMKAWL